MAKAKTRRTKMEKSHRNFNPHKWEDDFKKLQRQDPEEAAKIALAHREQNALYFGNQEYWIQAIGGLASGAAAVAGAGYFDGKNEAKRNAILDKAGLLSEDAAEQDKYFFDNKASKAPVAEGDAVPKDPTKLFGIRPLDKTFLLTLGAIAATPVAGMLAENPKTGRVEFGRDFRPYVGSMAQQLVGYNLGSFMNARGYKSQSEADKTGQ